MSGAAAIADFETGQAESLIERVYYDQGGNRFWVKSETPGEPEKWEPKSERQLARWLKARGVSASLSKEELQAGAVMSRLEETIYEVEQDRLVDLAGDFAGWKAGYQINSGKRILITEGPRLVEPVKPAACAPRRGDGSCHGWPLLGEFLETRLKGTDVVDQRPYHFAWLRRAYKSLAEGQPLRGHAVLFAGAVSCGKSLWIAVLRELFGRKIARPLRYIFGETNFNSEMFKSPLLVVDDEGAKTQIADRKLLAARVKQIVAVEGAACEGKGRDSMEIHTFMRIVFATNLEEQNLLVFPPIDDDLADKVHLFKFHAGPWPWQALMDGSADPDKTEKVIWRHLAAELPHFLWWLLNEFVLPDELYSQRFGVEAWHHPEILAGIDFLSPEARLWSWIERIVLRRENAWAGEPLPKGEWMGTAGDLEAVLRDPEAGLGWKERDKVPPANPTIGKYLGKLSERPSHAGMIAQRRVGKTGSRVWVLVSAERAEAERERLGVQADLGV